MGEFDAGYELTAFLVEVLREDADLHQLLFRDNPPINEFDLRVYESSVDLADARVANVLPRVLVAVDFDFFSWEQSANTIGPATVRIHHFAARDQSDLVAKLAKATATLFDALSSGSTPQLTTRIMIAPLSKAGIQVKDQQPAFDEARRITDTYATRLVGVLV